MLLPIVALALQSTLALASTPVADSSAFYGPSTDIQRIPLQLQNGTASVSVSLGTPAQSLTLRAALGVSDVFLLGSSCSGCATIFDGSASSTYVNYTSVNPISISSSGFMSSGEDVTIITASLDSARRLITSNFQGLLGFGYGYSSDGRYNANSPLANSMRLMNRTSFSVGVDVRRNGTSSVNWGSIDRSNSSIVSNFTWVPVFNYNTDNVGISGDWLTEIDSISFNGRNISLSNPNSSVAVLPNAAFVDVGAFARGDYLNLPSFVASRIWNLTETVNSTVARELRQVSCNSTASMTFTIGGRSLQLDARDLVGRNATDGTCYSTIVSNTLGFYQLGLPFLRSVYTAIHITNSTTNDTQQAFIGFAQKAVQIASPSNSSSSSGSGSSGTVSSAPLTSGSSAAVLAASSRLVVAAFL